MVRRSSFSLLQNNIQAIVLLVFSMAMFAAEDTLIKLASSDIKVGQLLFILSSGGFVILALAAKYQGHQLLTSGLMQKHILWRNFGDVSGAIFFVTALTLMPLSNVSAILQATPLVVTIGAALFLGEPVGWRRWTAILTGFTGVLIITRPGMAGFNMASILAILAVIGLAVRDMATRRIENNISTLVISASAFLALTIPAFIIMQYQGGWQSISDTTIYYLSFAIFIGPIAYYAITHAHRIGELSAIAPFRYTRLIFAIALGYFILGERPDIWVYIGSFLIIGSGIYALYREQIKSRKNT